MDLDLDQARRQAKELLRAAKSGDAHARARLRPDRPPRLADAQAAIAGELGFSSWPALIAGTLRRGDALHYAGLWGRASTVRLLLGRGADVSSLAEHPDQPSGEEWNALDWTAWGSRHTTAAADRSAAYRECAALLLDAGAPITGRVPIAHLIDEVRDSGLEYLPGTPVRIRIRVRGARVDVDDIGGAVAVAGMPTGWYEAAEKVVAERGWNIRRNGVVVMQAPRGRKLAWIVERTAEASAAVCDAIVQLEEP
jgi:hypothetical protein